MSVTCGQTIALEPNAPPTYSVSTRIFDGDSPSSAATVSCTALMPWHESYRVSWSPSQAAMVVSASSALWWLAANRNRASTCRSAAARPSATLPRSIRAGIRPPNSCSGS